MGDLHEGTGPIWDLWRSDCKRVSASALAAFVGILGSGRVSQRTLFRGHLSSRMNREIRLDTATPKITPLVPQFKILARRALRAQFPSIAIGLTAAADQRQR